MICEDARLLIGADPDAAGPELEEHVRGCDGCRAFRDEMRRLGVLRAADLAGVTGILPAMSSPTITSLARGDMHAVEAVVPKRGVNTLIPALKAAGGRDILEIPISKIVE